jgi:hypothetical protein
MKYIIHSSENKLAVTHCFESTESVVSRMGLKKGEYSVVEILDFVDHFFFDAYEFDREVGAKANIDKAKEIWLEHYRRARTPLLEKLDLEYMRADEAGNLELKKEIASKKQALRDVTKTDLPNTLEEIKSTWPEILGKNPFAQ